MDLIQQLYFWAFGHWDRAGIVGVIVLIWSQVMITPHAPILNPN